ncbi:hypothetical protein Btru_013512 [Bulinus truncatus]|nr:hypothetical protein Btru_013512 [Bulinus truncatus]
MCRRPLPTSVVVWTTALNPSDTTYAFSSSVPPLVLAKLGGEGVEINRRISFQPFGLADWVLKSIEGYHFSHLVWQTGCSNQSKDIISAIWLGRLGVQINRRISFQPFGLADGGLKSIKGYHFSHLAWQTGEVSFRDASKNRVQRARLPVFKDLQLLGPNVLYQTLLIHYLTSVNDEALRTGDMNSDFIEDYQMNKSFHGLINNLNESYGQSEKNGSLVQPGSIIQSVNVTEKCLSHINQLVSGTSLSEYWALSVVDSWGKPGPSLLEGRLHWPGNYHQCRDAEGTDLQNGTAGFKGNYCVLKIKVHKTKANVMAVFIDINVIRLGSCCPESCSEQEIDLLLQKGLELLNLSSTFESLNTECLNDQREITETAIASIMLATLIGALMIFGSLYDLYNQFTEKKSPLGAGSLHEAENEICTEDIVETCVEDIAEPVHSLSDQKVHPMCQAKECLDNTISSTDSELFLNIAHRQTEDTKMEPNILCQVLLAFSVVTNGSKLLSTNKPQDTLSAISGIRFISMTWVILGHCYTHGVEKFANAVSEFPHLLHRWSTDVISNSFVSVDTFFTLSGLLVSYLTLKEMHHKGWKINWGLFYFHRFWRLTPTYMLVLLFVLGFQRFLGSGALWDTVQPHDKVACEKNWWTNVLYINNIVHRYEKCFGHSWYLANDMQFFWLSPLMLIPFHFNLFSGIGACLFFLIGQWICTAVLSVHYNWPTVMAALDEHTQQMSDHWMKNYYIVPWCRIGPYVVGIMAGYKLAASGGKVSISKYSAAFGWISTTLTGLAVVYGLRGDIGGESPSHVGMAALYNAVARSAWGACVCWVIIACVSGYGGPVNTILSWSPLVPLGRLTYMAYLIHPCLIRVYYGNHEVPFYLNDTNLVVSYLGITVFTYMTAFVLNLALESPMIALEKIMFKKK